MTINSRIEAGADYRWFGNTLVALRLSHSDGADGLSIIEHWMPHGDSPPLHVHDREDEVFHILDGMMRFQVGDKVVFAGRGETVLAPKGIAHSYRAESPDGVHCLTIMRGGDFEAMVRQASRPASEARLPEPAAPAPEAIAMLTQLCSENNIRIMGPPLAA